MIWGQCKAAYSNRLVKLQKRAARIIFQVDFSSPSQSTFKEMKWLDIPNRVVYHTCIMVYKALNGLAPEYIADLFKNTSDIHSRNLRSVDNELLRISHSRTSYNERPFSIVGAKRWNLLPLDIKLSSSLNAFKTTLK